MKNFILAWWWNKWLLSCLISVIIISAGIAYVNWAYSFLLIIVAIILILCNFGQHTYQTYNRCVRAYKAGRKIYIEPQQYCEDCALKWFQHDYPNYKKCSK